MRVAFVNTRSDAVGGSQVHVRDLAHALRRMGHEVMAFVGGDGPVVDFLAERGVPCVSLRHLVHEIRLPSDGRALREACGALRAFRPDVVSTHTSKAGVIGRAAARALGVPSIFTAHGWNFTDGIEDCNRGFRVGMERTCARWSARIITVSESDRQLALRHRVAPPSKVQTIHNGMPDVSRALRADPATQPPRIVMVARFEPQKDHRTFLEALSGLAHLPWHVEFIGGGPLLGETRELAGRLGIADRIEFAGACNDVTARLARAQVFALVSNWEGLPRSIIEAMRAGLPVIASDVGGTREMVSPGETGFLVPRGDVQTLRDHLATLVTSPGLRSRLGRRGRDRYEAQFTFDAMLRRTLRVYEEVVAPGARTPAAAPAPARTRARRVVHVVESFGAGTAGVIGQLTRGMPEYRHVVVYGRRPEAATVSADGLGRGVTAVEWGGAGREINPLRDGAAFLRLLGILRRVGKIDLLHAHSAKGGFHGRLAARLLGMPRACVYTTHGSPVLRGDVRPWAHRLYLALERLGAALAGTVVACSASEHQILRAAGVNATVICNGVEPGADDAPRMEAPRTNAPPPAARPRRHGRTSGGTERPRVFPAHRRSFCAAARRPLRLGRRRRAGARAGRAERLRHRLAGGERGAAGPVRAGRVRFDVHVGRPFARRAARHGRRQAAGPAAVPRERGRGGTGRERVPLRHGRGSGRTGRRPRG